MLSDLNSKAPVCSSPTSSKGRLTSAYPGAMTVIPLFPLSPHTWSLLIPFSGDQLLSGAVVYTGLNDMKDTDLGRRLVQ